MSGEIVTIAPGKLYALVNPFELDGRVTSYASDARGFAPANSSVYVEGDRAIFVETSFSVHEASLVAQLRSVLPATATVSLFPPRLGEFDSICNERPVVEHFTVDALYGAHLNGTHWIDFRPDYNPPDRPLQSDKIDHLELRIVAAHDTVNVDPAGTRKLDAFHPVLRLLLTHWLYDEQTRSLFTSDVFTHVWRATEAGPWVVTSPEDGASFEGMRDHLLGARYWWLAGARTEPIRRGLADVFERYEIDTILPSFGCILQGRRVVERHYDVLQQVLAELGAATEAPRAVSSGTP